MNRLVFCAIVVAVLSPCVRAQSDLDPKWAAPVFAADAPERKLRQTALQHKREDVNRRDRQAWAKIANKFAWERFRDEKLELLRKSLGPFPEAPKKVPVMTTRTLEGDGFIIDNIVYESRPGLVVTANLYSPAKTPAQAPGIVVIHSHHNPKTQGELQDMGMLWARAGCYVLVPDQLDHGERRQHPFATEKDYPLPYKVSRQDYFFRYNVAAQLHLVGESLVGWMVWDMMRGIDVLLERPGIDADKIVVLGSVAGGGDPCAVLAALDKRIAVSAPFNFGGPQPETKFPLPENADEAFNFMGGGSWESTRNLRLSGRDGFLPWVIVGAVAPRGLIYAHEFAWDENRDPVWKRFHKIYGFYDKADRLAEVHGRGSVSGMAPESTHCNNIGLEHRKGIHPPLAKWLGIDAKEFAKRFPSADLQCLTAEAKTRFAPQPVWALASKRADERLARAREERGKRPPGQSKLLLQLDLAEALGLNVLPAKKRQLETIAEGKGKGVAWKTQIIRHPNHGYLAIPALWLMPEKAADGTPVVIGVAHAGKKGFLENRAAEVQALLNAGVAICLPDLRGTGEMRTTGEGRGRTSAATSYSASEWMHGGTLLGAQVQELLVVIDTAQGLNFGPIALWGDSFAPVNDPDAKIAVPYDVDAVPAIGEPMGGLVALFAGLYADDSVKAIHVRGSLASYRSVLQSPFFYLPHDSLIPGVLTVADLDDVAAIRASRPISIEAAIDGLNQRANARELESAFARTKATGKDRVVLRETAGDPGKTAAWFAKALGR